MAPFGNPENSGRIGNNVIDEHQVHIETPDRLFIALDPGIRKTGITGVLIGTEYMQAVGFTIKKVWESVS